jgi:diguanylate cyclase (GGDEF)-like protein/PAS domain S-box-containing protein
MEEMAWMERGGAQAALGDQALLVIDVHGLIRHCTARAGGLLTQSPAALRGRPCTEVLPDLPLRRQTPGYNLAYLMMAYAPGDWHQGDVLAGDGRQLRLDLSLTVLNLGKHFWILVGLRLPPPEIQLRNHLDRLIAGLAASQEAAVVTNPMGIIEYVNPAYEALTGYGLGEAVGQTQRILKSGLHPPPFYQALWDALRAGRAHRAVFANRARNGKLFYLDEVLRPFMDRQGRITHFVSIGRDVTHQILVQEELQHRANFDGLTGLANRQLLMDRLCQEIARARREAGKFALVCVDLDSFKAINDRYGHAAGDAALRGVSAQLVQAVREMDTVARWGGDEFLLMLPGVFEPMDVAAVLRKIVASVHGPMAGPCWIPITLSAGAAVFPADGDEADQLIQMADAAMYQAKNRGGNGYCTWSAAARGRAAESVKATPRLRRARPGRAQLTCVHG